MIVWPFTIVCVLLIIIGIYVISNITNPKYKNHAVFLGILIFIFNLISLIIIFVKIATEQSHGYVAFLLVHLIILMGFSIGILWSSIDFYRTKK
jgi:hypothetical protein